MYHPKFTDFTSSEYGALCKKVAQRHPHYVILVVPGRRMEPAKFADAIDLVSSCDLFWDEHSNGIVRIPEYEDEVAAET